MAATDSRDAPSGWAQLAAGFRVVVHFAPTSGDHSRVPIRAVGVDFLLAAEAQRCPGNSGETFGVYLLAAFQARSRLAARDPFNCVANFSQETRALVQIPDQQRPVDRVLYLVEQVRFGLDSEPVPPAQAGCYVRLLGLQDAEKLLSISFGHGQVLRE